MSIVQEKFQTIAPRQPDGENEWKSVKRVLVKKDIPHGNNAFLGTLPPGMDIEDAEIADIRQQEVHLSGTTDVSHDTNRTALKKGYSLREMSPTDDMYTREHNDAFYDDVGGFVERNNVLDRL